MAVLCFSDILKKAGLDPSRVKLIRHVLANREFRACYENNMVLEYTRHQKDGFGKGCDYWCVFISESGTLARLFACYQVVGAVPNTPDQKPKGFPLDKNWFDGKASYFSLTPVDILAEYEDRLLIDWGSSRMWHQKGTIEKPVAAIQARQKKVFPGFEHLVLTYDELKEIIENPTVYETWHTALSSINAIYLIVDRETGKQYVGSSSGKDGLLGRWRCYAAFWHGNNKQMKALICSHPDRYHKFQFSILQILPKTAADQDIIHIETLYKKKLLSYTPFGMNDN